MHESAIKTALLERLCQRTRVRASDVRTHVSKPHHAKSMSCRLVPSTNQTDAQGRRLKLKGSCKACAMHKQLCAQGPRFKPTSSRLARAKHKSGVRLRPVFEAHRLAQGSRQAQIRRAPKARAKHKSGMRLRPVFEAHKLA